MWEPAHDNKYDRFHSFGPIVCGLQHNDQQSRPHTDGFRSPTTTMLFLKLEISLSVKYDLLLFICCASIFSQLASRFWFAIVSFHMTIDFQAHLGGLKNNNKKLTSNHKKIW